MRVGLLVLLALAAVALGLSAAGAAPADPWIGKWKSVDGDGSNQALTITRRPDGAYDVILFDDRATICGGSSATGRGVGTVSGNTMSGTTTVTCADGRQAGVFPFKGTYDAGTDTFTDGLGVVWSRAREPAPPPPSTGRPLPLGRLVLGGREAQGLRPRAAKAGAAKKVLASAFRPARLPRFSPKQTRISHFSRGKNELWSIAFAMRNPSAARAAANAVSRSARTSRQPLAPARLGDGGFVLGPRRKGRRQVVAVWRRGRVLGAVVFAGPFRPSGVRAVALGYTRLADTVVARAVSKTAWQRVLDRVGPRGRISRRTALDMFALAYAPLPGTNRPPGPDQPIRDGTSALRGILLYWNTLTADQRAAASKLAGITSFSRSRRGAAAGRFRPLRALGSTDFGDPSFTPNEAFQKEAEQFAAIFQKKLGHTLGLKLVVGTTNEPIKGADALPIDPGGNIFTDAQHCRIRIGPNALPGALKNVDARRYYLAHEVFHCMQFSVVGVSGWAWRHAGNWLWDGSADWAAYRVNQSPWWLVSSFRVYLDTCAERSLFARQYDAVGFFGHSDDSGLGSFWSRAPSVFKAGVVSDLAAFETAGGSQDALLGAWAASPLAVVKFGLSWEMYSPVLVPLGGGCPTFQLIGDTAVSSIPLASALYTIEPGVVYVDRPLVHVLITAGRARISDGQWVDQNVVDSWFWIGDEDGPKCPEDTEGVPPPAPALRRPAVLGLTGGQLRGAGTVTFVSLKEFCKEKQKSIPIVPIPPSKGGGGSVKCSGKCGQSTGDPHLTTFDQVAYDFMAVGEFTLVRSKKGDFEIQVRQTPYPGSRVVSITSAAAMRVARNRVVILKGEPPSVRVNGRPVLVSRKGLQLPGGGKLRGVPPEFRGLPGQLEVSWPDGTVARVWSAGEEGLSLLVKPARSREGKLVGLLGNADRRPGNDFATRTGRRLNPTTIRRGTGGRNYRVLYRQYGDSWRISRRSSLFDYAPGESPRTFTDRRYPAPIDPLSSADKRLLERARRLCEKLHIKDPAIFAGCVLDVALTRNFDFATAAARLERAAQSREAPAPPGSKKTRATVRYEGRKLSFVGGTCTALFGSFDLNIGTSQTGDKKPYFGIGVAYAPKDGTYSKGAGVVFEADGELVVSGRATVTLAGKLTRGTFRGVELGSDKPFSGSFRC